MWVPIQPLNAYSQALPTCILPFNTYTKLTIIPPSQRLNALRLEADTAQSAAEELKGKVKAAEQENLSKENEIKSLKHRNQLLEEQVEKLEEDLKKSKSELGEVGQQGTHNEALQRRLQILEEEAEESDRNQREVNEKYVLPACWELSKHRFSLVNLKANG